MVWQVAASAWALGIGLVDWREKRIPNLLLVPGLVLAAAAIAGLGAQVDALSAGLAVLVALGLSLPGYLLGKTGAGDVKCLAVMGACVGTVGAIELFLLSSGVFGLVCAVQLWRRRRLDDPANQRLGRLPMGPALVAGFLSVVWLGPWVLRGLA